MGRNGAASQDPVALSAIPHSQCALWVPKDAKPSAQKTPRARCVHSSRQLASDALCCVTFASLRPCLGHSLAVRDGLLPACAGFRPSRRTAEPAPSHLPVATIMVRLRAVRAESGARPSVAILESWRPRAPERGALLQPSSEKGVGWGNVTTWSVQDETRPPEGTRLIDATPSYPAPSRSDNQRLLSRKVGEQRIQRRIPALRSVRKGAICRLLRGLRGRGAALRRAKASPHDALRIEAPPPRQGTTACRAAEDKGTAS